MSQNPVTGIEEYEAAISIGRGDSRKHRRSAIYEYNFSREGGAIGTFFLRGPSLPEGAVLVGSYIDVVTVPTSGGAATIGLGIVTTTDLNAEDAISGAPWSSTGLVDPDAGPEEGTESGYIKITSANPRQVRATVGTAALTAGRFFVVIAYDVLDS